MMTDFNFFKLNYFWL